MRHSHDHPMKSFHNDSTSSMIHSCHSWWQSWTWCCRRTTLKDKTPKHSNWHMSSSFTPWNRMNDMVLEASFHGALWLRSIFQRFDVRWHLNTTQPAVISEEDETNKRATASSYTAKPITTKHLGIQSAVFLGNTRKARKANMNVRAMYCTQIKSEIPLNINAAEFIRDIHNLKLFRWILSINYSIRWTRESWRVYQPLALRSKLRLCWRSKSQSHPVEKKTWLRFHSWPVDQTLPPLCHGPVVPKAVKSKSMK